ncbi:hypothetical protein [Streptomyces sp. HNM0574]|uniref:FAD-dependent oxidoreductase n=1 Tax=Streptomyces sp. HNM0574 TaxID=2714954 RepID=UPI00146ACCA9|nr:hypothetical protein [Streptomyces sp. HNM0574]NLU70675.1 hypothetical protein [Streptomyces sp. HNM0574]
MGERFGHAVVLGAGMGGLLSAAALARHFARVTVVERDRLTDSDGHPHARPEATWSEDGVPEDEGAALREGPRRGVPQGRHVHGLLARGSESMERLLPGLVDELAEAGALLVRPLLETRYLVDGRALARGEAGPRVVLGTRPLLESVIRARVAALPAVGFADGRDVMGPVHEGGRVTGVRTAPAGGGGAEEVWEAELVVDALGRAGRSARWLAELGCPAPPEDRVKVDLGYASRFVRLPEGAFGGDQAVLIGNVPGFPTRGLGVLRQEDDRWLITLAGMAGDHPGGDDETFAAFLRTVAPPELAGVVDGAEPVGGIATFRFPEGVRRRYERLQAPPEGLLAVGDAHCSFNPVYGQGMTVAAMEALCLDAALAEGGTAGLPRRYYREAARAVRPAWELAVGADLSVPQVPGRRTAVHRVTQRYTERLRRAAVRDPRVAGRSCGRLSSRPRRLRCSRLVRWRGCCVWGRGSWSRSTGSAHRG